MELFNNIGKLIKEKREEKGISQRRLAELTNISNTEISRIESRARKRPAPYILKRIAPHIGVGYKELLSVAGYEELLVQENDHTVKEDTVPYVEAVRDFSDRDLTPEEVEKLKEYQKFLLSQREKKE